jgi:hypothetical protein
MLFFGVRRRSPQGSGFGFNAHFATCWHQFTTEQELDFGKCCALEDLFVLAASKLCIASRNPSFFVPYFLVVTCCHNYRSNTSKNKNKYNTRT